MKRSPLRSRPRRLTPEDQAERAHVLARDSGCALATTSGTSGSCLGYPTFHHLRKQGQGGKYLRSNGVTLCQYHNDWCEDFPLVAHTLGLVLRAGEPEAAAWAKMRTAGLPVGYEPEVEG